MVLCVGTCVVTERCKWAEHLIHINAKETKNVSVSFVKNIGSENYRMNQMSKEKGL